MMSRFPGSRVMDLWSWLDAPEASKRMLKSSLSFIREESSVIPEGRHEWFLCVAPEAVKLRGNNRVQVVDVLRGRKILDAEGKLTEASKDIRTGVFICRIVVHDCGVFHMHDVSPMEDYDIGFCPVLPRVIRERLDVAYSRYSRQMTFEREAAKPFSFKQPPPLLHNLAPVDVDAINEKSPTEDSVVDLTGSVPGDENNIIREVMTGKNKAVTVASISCSTMIPRVVSLAARAAVMSCDGGKPVATVTQLNPCVACPTSTFVGNNIISQSLESCENSLDSSVDEPTSEGEE